MNGIFQRFQVQLIRIQLVVILTGDGGASDASGVNLVHGIAAEVQR